MKYHELRERERPGQQVMPELSAQGQTPEREAKLLERQRGINMAFGRMYFAIYSVNLVTDMYWEISTLDIFREHIPPQGDKQLLFDMVVEHYVTPEYQDSMREFFRMDTIQERLQDRNAVSNEFFGTTQGWCRASFVVEDRDEEDAVRRFAYVTQEINREKREERERLEDLNRAYLETAEANRAKSDFLFKMSHDIRTPLNAVMGFERLIYQNADNPEKVRDYAAKIRVSGNLLLSLLNEILDMTKIESGSVRLSETPFSLDDLISEMDTVVRAQARAKRQSFSTQKETADGIRLIGDRVCLGRILFNILGNAVKYTGEGGSIRFIVREEKSETAPGAGEADETKKTLCFSVEDNGPGIDPSQQAHIFETFYRGEDVDAAKIPGTGLGLSIAKGFTEVMGGTITVDSSPDRGSVFTVRIKLPLAEAETGEETAEETFEERSILEGLHILVVEDNEINMEIVTELLRLSGADCEEAESGQEALEKISASALYAYDLVIMDIRMPGMDGYETTRRIRALERADAETMPIIALTANAFPDDVENSRKAGMDAHLAKPLNMEELRRTVRRLRDSGEQGAAFSAN